MLARCSIPSRGSRLLVVLNIDKDCIAMNFLRGEGVRTTTRRYRKMHAPSSAVQHEAYREGEGVNDEANTNI